MTEFKYQVGKFFLVIGIIMLAVFFVTLQGQDPEHIFLFGGVVIGVVGVSLMVRNRSSLTSESARFRLFRHYRQQARDRREQSRQKRQEYREREP